MMEWNGDGTMRPCSSSDHAVVTRKMKAWWGGRELSLPKLFFDHFQDTSFIVEVNGEIVGFLIGFLSQSREEEAYIHFVGVDPAYRKLGIAAALYDRFFEKVVEHGRLRVRAITSPVNRLSIAYHTRMGFTVVPGDKVVDGVEVHVDYDGKGVERVLFVKDLKGRSG